MIQTLYTIGKVLSQEEEYQKYFEPWEVPFKDNQTDAKPKVIVVNIRNGQIETPIITEYRPKWSSKYLYREALGRSTNIVPTFKYYVLKGNRALDEWEKSQKNSVTKTLAKVKASIKNYKHDFINTSQVDELADTLFEFTKTNLDADLLYLLTFTINDKYFGEYDKFRDLFFKDGNEKYYKKVYGNSMKQDYHCALTGKKSTVFGYVNTLGFTVNDKAFMRNGFNQNDSYKMFPVSSEAFSLLNGAMEFTKNEIIDSFYGKIKFIILPQFLDHTETKYKQRIIKRFTQKDKLNINYEKNDKGLNGFIKGTENYINSIIEEGILQQVNYEVLFFSKPNPSEISLHLHIMDVLPSHLEIIFWAKRNIQSYYAPITNTYGKKKDYIFKINLYEIKDFFMSERATERIPHPFFYRLVEAIFCNQKINQSTVLKFIVDDLRRKFKKRHTKPYAYISSTKEGFVLLQFLEKLGLFHTENQNNMENDNKKVALNALEFIEQHKAGFFKPDYIKGAFLFGCLVKRLTYNQQNDAFLKELNNLVIDKHLINKKFPKLIDKLRKYKKEFKDLENEASNYFVTGHADKISKDEISMAVTLGLILQSGFDTQKS